MSKLFTRATVSGATLAGATLKTSLVALWDALNTLGVTDSTRSTVTATATLTTTQAGLVPIDATSAAITLTLPTSGTSTDEVEYDFRRVDSTAANIVTIQRGGTDTIEGSSTVPITIPPGGIVKIKIPAGSTNWRITKTSSASPATQALTAFTTTGSAAAYVLTPTPAVAALATNQRFRVKFSFSTTGACTLAVSGTTATALKQYDSTGSKIDPTIVSGQLSDVEYDGTHWVVLNPLPALSRPFPSVRQTVLSGPVDSNGLPSFGGSTGTTTVTASGTLVATAANGSDVSGNIDRVGSITNPSWTGLATNGTMYLYLDIAANGTCTTGSTTLAPVYQWGGTYSITNNQFTYNIQAMSGQVGNGASAAQTYRVFVGEVTVAGAVVTAITWYALQGRYEGPWTATIPAGPTNLSVNANIGTDEITAPLFELKCTTTDVGYAVGDIVQNVGYGQAGYVAPLPVGRTRNTAFVSIPSNSIVLFNKTSPAAGVTVTAASWSYRFRAIRGW